MEIGIEEAAAGLYALLSQVRGEMDAALRQAGSDVGLKNIYPYFTDNVGTDDYPLIMIQEVRETLQWYALPSIMENVFQFTIWGLVTHDDPAVCVNMRRALANALKRHVNRHHGGVRTAAGLGLEFSSPYPPIYGIDYNVAQQSNAIVRGFAASFSADVHPSITDRELPIP